MLCHKKPCNKPVAGCWLQVKCAQAFKYFYPRKTCCIIQINTQKQHGKEKAEEGDTEGNGKKGSVFAFVRIVAV